jgi:hypothetical protein
MVRRADPIDIPSVPANSSIEALVDCLKSLHTQQAVRLYFKDGREEIGFVTYTPRTGYGRYIDRVREESGTFNIHSLTAIDTNIEL